MFLKHLLASDVLNHDFGSVPAAAVRELLDRLNNRDLPPRAVHMISQAAFYYRKGWTGSAYEQLGLASIERVRPKLKRKRHHVPRRRLPPKAYDPTALFLKPAVKGRPGANMNFGLSSMSDGLPEHYPNEN